MSSARPGKRRTGPVRCVPEISKRLKSPINYPNGQRCVRSALARRVLRLNKLPAPQERRDCLPRKLQVEHK